MSVGFRKSLFGFNCDDVVSYVEKTHKAFTEKEIVLNEQIDDLKSDNGALKEQIAEITAEKAEIEAKLKVFTDKYEEIERLSKNIGKLYLVAKTNAQTVMKEAQESADLARKEAELNITSIINAQESLGSVKENIVSTSAKFASDIDALGASLEETRRKIAMHEAATVKSEEEYRELIKVLSNE